MNKNNVPKIRFPGFTEPWEQRKLGDILTCIPFKQYLKSPEQDGKFEIIQQGNEPIIGYANGNPCNDFKDTVVFGDHTLSLYKPKEPFFVATDGVRIIKGLNSMNGNYLNVLLEKYKPQSEGYKRYFSILSDKQCYITNNHDEQIKIGKYFEAFDNLISLNQRKLEHLQKQKKGLLQKMFPKAGAKVPEIRFPEFTSDWEQRKLKEVFISLQNNTLSRAELSDKEGIAKNVHYGDILIKFGECLDIKKYTLPLITEESIIVKYKSSFLQNGDIIVADTAEDETVGKCSEIVGLEDEIVLSGLHTIAYRPMFRFASGYLGYYMNSNLYHNQLLPLIQGIKVSSISKSAMQDTIIMYPKLIDEQAKIGELFKQLDNLITLHQRKLEHLQKQKKALLQQMFI